MRKPIACICAALLAVGLVTVGLSVPAQAADGGPTVVVANSIYSVDNIIAYNPDVGVSVSINQGSQATISDRNGAARVDVDPSGGEGDVDKWRKSGGSWSPWYCNEDNSSNPFSGSPPDNVTVYQTSSASC